MGFKLGLSLIITLVGMIFFTLALLLLMFTLGLSKKKNSLREKMSPFECGFEPKSAYHQPFSIRFFFILLMFLIFDVEIIIILPMIASFSNMLLLSLIGILIGFMILLILGILMEIKLGTFSWS